MEAWKWCMSVAHRCTNMHQLKATQAIFTTNGLHRNTFAINKLLAFCALSDTGSLSYASLIFTQIHEPNPFTYNTLIRAYSRSPHPHSALHYFHLMLNSHTFRPDQHTFPFVLIACANASSACSGKQVHNWVFKNGLAASDGHVQTALIRLYSECNILSDARKVFDEITADAFQCNMLISAYVRLGFASEGLNVFRDMLVSGVGPDEFCVTTALTACSHLGALEPGKWIHEYVKRRKGLTVDVFLGTALVDMYAKCGCVGMAAEVFEEMPKRNVWSWAAIIKGFGVNGYARKAIECLERMQEEDGIRPDGVVLLGVLTACAHAGLLKEGQFLLDNMEARHDVVPKHEHYSCVVDLLCKAGQLDEALQLIKRMPMKPLTSVWGALLTGCQMTNNVHLAELAAKELLLIQNDGDNDEAYGQLSNIYMAARRSEDANTTRRMIDDRGLKKTRGCSVIEVDREANQ